MAGNFKKSKQKKSKVVAKRTLPNLQNTKGFSPLRKAILEQTVKKIVGKNLSESSIDDPDAISSANHQPDISRQQIPEKNKKTKQKPQNMDFKKIKYSAGHAGDYMDFAVAVASQPKTDFLKKCSSYLQETKQQLQSLYFARRQDQEDIQTSSLEKPEPTFRFSPQTVPSSPPLNPLDTLRETYTKIKKNYPMSSQMKACPYCGRDFSPAETVTEVPATSRKREMSIVSPDFSFTYYPHKF